VPVSRALPGLADDGGVTTVLGIDLGTSSVKVVVLDRDGRVVSHAAAGYEVARPRAGWAETDPADWWRAVEEAVARVPTDGVEAVGLSGQMHGVVLTAEDGTPTRPAVLWADSRAEPQLARYRGLPDDVRARLANPLSPGMAGPMLAWLNAHEPGAVARAHAALQPKDWLRARLTGTTAAEPSDASATLLYDVLTQDWDDGVVDALGIDRGLLPRILPTAATIAGETGDGTPVAAGAADTAAAALGAGLTQPGTVQLTIGTGVQLVTPVAAPTRAQLTIDPATHLYRSATDDGWYAMAAGLSGGQTLDWVRRLLGLDWPALYATAARGPRPGDPVFLPHLVGERTPYLDTRMRGAWAGLDVRHDREALCWSALEGVAFAVADAYDALRDARAGLAPADPRIPPTRDGGEIRLAGGGSVAPEWRQLLADVLGTPLRPVEVPDASARGAALLAARAAGRQIDTGTPGGDAATGTAVDPRTTDAVAERRALYRDTLDALRQLPFTPDSSL
jgi:xylulokinase